MRIVFVANWWYRRGGLGAVMLDEAAELERRGHEIIPFAARHPDNLSTPWSRYFPEFRETADLGAAMSIGSKATMAIRLVHNGEAGAAFARLLDDARPDVIHLHNVVRQLSPAILGSARRRRIPVVMTLHDYSLVCPQGLLLKGERVACTAPNCVRGNPLPAVLNRCIRRRLVPSTVAAIVYGVHRATKAYSASVQLMLAPSRFLESTLVEGGSAARKIRYLPNGIAPGEDPPSVPQSEGLVLFAGRVAGDKGLDVLLAAAHIIPEVPIVVAGDGPLRHVLETTAPRSVRFLGQQSPEDLRRLRADAVAIVSPSIWYENAPITVLEAMRDGRPTIVSAIGGQMELVDGGAGIAVRPRDPIALAEAIRLLWQDRRLANEMGRAGRARLLASYTLDQHVSELEAIYREAGERARGLA
jgi:glycosyltransferase involved in cell wall biosynthesis